MDLTLELDIGYQRPISMPASPEDRSASVIPTMAGGASLRNPKRCFPPKSPPLGSFPAIETSSWCSPVATLPV